MNAGVRSACADDLPVIDAFVPAFLEPPYKRGRFLHALRDGEVVVAIHEGAVAGFMWLNVFFGHTFVNVLAVAPQYRRQGHAGTLLGYAERNALTDRVFTSTNRSNAAMQAALKRYGWKRCGEIDDLDLGDPEIVYVKYPS